MLKKDSPIFLQNINMIARHFFLLLKSLRLSGTTLVYSPGIGADYALGSKLFHDIKYDVNLSSPSNDFRTVFPIQMHRCPHLTLT